jgi:hypothetical protein
MLTDDTNYKTHLERYSRLTQYPFHGDYGVLMNLFDPAPCSMLEVSIFATVTSQPHVYLVLAQYDNQEPLVTILHRLLVYIPVMGSTETEESFILASDFRHQCTPNLAYLPDKGLEVDKKQVVATVAPMDVLYAAD